MKKSLTKRLIAFCASAVLIICIAASCNKAPITPNGPTNTYTPPTNEDGYIVVNLPIGSTNESSAFYWTSVEKNENGGFDYTFTPEQFQKTKQALFLHAKLINPETSAYKEGFIRDTVYENVDENGIPWALEVYVDRALYESPKEINAFWLTTSVSVYMRLYQIFCGVPSDEYRANLTVKDADTDEIIAEFTLPIGDK